MCPAIVFAKSQENSIAILDFFRYNSIGDIFPTSSQLKRSGVLIVSYSKCLAKCQGKYLTGRKWM